MQDDDSKQDPKESKGENDIELIQTTQLLYKISENPPFFLSIFLAMQHFLTIFGGIVMSPLLITEMLCVGGNNLVRGELVCTTTFVLGVASFLHVTFGSRLPMVEGAAIEYFVALMPLLELEKCSSIEESNNNLNNTTDVNFTTSIDSQMDSKDWMLTMRKVQGAIIISGLVEAIIGGAGLVGVIRKYVSPLTILPSMLLLGLALLQPASELASKHWAISSLTILLAVILSQYMYEIEIPCFKYKKGKGCHTTKFPVFKMFAIILAILISWILCAIFTLTDVFPNDPSNYNYHARTDIRESIVEKTPWFRMPYPGQWGSPVFTVSTATTTIAIVLASIVNSLGEYYTLARICEIPPPPDHAMNRGIAVEGIGSMLAGFWGVGTAITTSSENIGLVEITKVASRNVIQIMSFIMVLLGTLGKFGAIFITIPDPVIGGVICIGASIYTGIALANIQNVDVTSRRNLFILGFAIFMGLLIPQWLTSNMDVLQTGNSVLDDILKGLLTSGMFVSGFFALILDNSIKGTLKERGMAYAESNNSTLLTEGYHFYDLPFQRFIDKVPVFRFWPACPAFNTNFQWKKKIFSRRNKLKNEKISKNKLLNSKNTPQTCV